MSTLQPSGHAAAPAAARAKPSKACWEEQLLTGSRGPALALLVLCVALTIYSPFFLTKDNLLNVIDQVTVLGILALGMTAVIIIGGIDLSVGAVLALAMMILGWLSHDGGLPVSLAVIGALAAGAAAGAVNGVMITYARLPAFIATLAMLSVARGLANVITDGQQIVGFPSSFDSLSSSRLLGWVSATVAILLVLYVAGWAFLRYRANGRACTRSVAAPRSRASPASARTSSRSPSTSPQGCSRGLPRPSSPCGWTRRSRARPPATSSTRSRP